MSGVQIHCSAGKQHDIAHGTWPYEARAIPVVADTFAGCQGFLGQPTTQPHRLAVISAAAPQQGLLQSGGVANLISSKLTVRSAQ